MKNEKLRNILNARIVNHVPDNNILSTVNGKTQSLYMPGQTQRISGCWGSQISRKLTNEGGKVVSPTHRPLLTPRIIPGTHLCQRLSRPQRQGATGMITSMKSSNDHKC